MKKINAVWIIDDDSIQVFLAKRILTNLGFSKNIRAMDNAEIALKELQARKPVIDIDFPSIIFVDINMPQLDGWQFLQEFEKLNLEREVDIYLVTSSLNPIDLERAKTFEHLSGYLIKPLKITDLAEIRNNYTV